MVQQACGYYVIIGAVIFFLCIVVCTLDLTALIANSHWWLLWVLHNIRCLNKEMSIFMIENMNGHFLGHVSLTSSEGVTLFQNRLLLLFCPTLTEPERVLRDVTDLATVAMVAVYYCFHSSGSQISATYLLPSGTYKKVYQ